MTWYDEWQHFKKEKISFFQTCTLLNMIITKTVGVLNLCSPISFTSFDGHILENSINKMLIKNVSKNKNNFTFFLFYSQNARY